MPSRKQQTLRFWRYVSILRDDFSLRRFLANFSVCHKFWICFSSSVRQKHSDKVRFNKQKCFFFPIIDALVVLHFLNFVHLAVASQRVKPRIGEAAIDLWLRP